MNNVNNNRLLFILIGIIVIMILIVAGIALIHHHGSTVQNSVTIIVAARAADAPLALGGFLASHKGPTIIADFFDPAPAAAPEAPTTSSTSAPDVATSTTSTPMSIEGASVTYYSYSDNAYGTDTAAEESAMAKTIQALLVGNAGKTVSLYGPAIFNTVIGDPDTNLLHAAFMDVANGSLINSSTSTNPAFYIYENYPEIQQFDDTVVYSLGKNLENEFPALSFTEVQIPLSASALDTKVKTLQSLGYENTSADQAFTETRCGIDPDQTCEVVYKIGF